MADIRLKTETYTIDGKEYVLCCNMNVLAEVQEQNGGAIYFLLDGDRSIGSALTFAAAMLNDYADLQGWEERFTAKTLGRKITYADTIPFVTMVGGVIRTALGMDKAETDTDTTTTAENTAEKNV